MSRKSVESFLVKIMIVLLVLPQGLLAQPVEASSEEDESEEVIYHETFEDGYGYVEENGDASIEHETDINGDETGIYVDDRASDHDGADIHFDNLDLRANETYTISVEGYVSGDVEVPEDAESWLQLPADGYEYIAGAKFVSGEAFEYEGDYTTREFDDYDDDQTAFRIQSNEEGEETPFYITNVLITTETESEESDEEDADDEDEALETIYHETFEDGESDLSGADAHLEHVSDKEFDGNENGEAIFIDDRSDDWHGANLDLSYLDMELGKEYVVTVNAYVDEDTEVPEGSEMLVQDYEEYESLYLDAGMEPGNAMSVSGTYPYTNDEDEGIRIQSNGDGAEVPFYVGEIKIEYVVGSDLDLDDEEEGEDEDYSDAEEFEFIDFEDEELNDFYPREDVEDLSITNEVNHTEDGEYALKVEGREEPHEGPAINVADYIDPGTEYEVTLWAKLNEPSSAELTLSTQIGDSSPSYQNISSAEVTDEEWVELSGTYRYSSRADGYVSLYVESDNEDASFYIDDVMFEALDTEDVSVDTSLTPIKDVYADDFYIGNAVSMNEMSGDRLELLTHHHNMVTAENAMKPEYNYDNPEEELDPSHTYDLVERIREENLLLHGHVLVWHEQSHDLLYEDEGGNPLSRDEAIDNMDEHIRTVMAHYGDDVHSWDVVNEAIVVDNSEPLENWEAHLRNTGWYEAIGEDYIQIAFEIARDAMEENDLDMTLFYNDYNDHIQTKAQVIYYMVKDINEQHAAENDGELLIDGVGMQGHYSLGLNPENVRTSMERFIDLGVEIGVTELDVTAGSDGVLTEEEEMQQAYIYARLFEIYKEHADDISRVTIWGLNDASSWRSDQPPLLFDDDLQAKEAYHAVIDPEGFLDSYEPPEDIVREAESVYTDEAPSIDGEMDDVWNEASTLSVDRMHQAWQTGTGIARTLWDEEYLYVFMEVSNSELDISAEEAHEQDSVEIFLDQENTKASSYEDGVGQYRVNYENVPSFNPPEISEGFESATSLSGTNYTVEAKIPWTEISPETGQTVGFDAQVNDAEDGERRGAALWNDETGQGWQDPSVFGNLHLVDELEQEIEEVEVEEGVLSPVFPNQRVRLGESSSSVTTPSDLPADTEIEVNTVEEVQESTSDSGVELTQAGDVIDVSIDYSEEQEAYEGEFILELEYDESYDDVAIYYASDEESEWERRGGEAENGVIRLAVSGFSRYGVFEDEEDVEIDDLLDVIEDLDDRITELEESSVDTSELEDTVEQLYEEIETLEADNDEQQAMIDDLADRVQTLDESVSEQEEEVEEESEETDEETETSEDEDDKVTMTDEGETLPDTATSTFNGLLIGLLFILAGGATLFILHRRQTAKQ
ncbi:endo-1,4-beta-xylanase [Pelagirhabdus alkalitolerans]|uniref:Beta-xylanase n=1 Tax=Pelagirhabdus alkalitolerans TaxID=1612202 RepID=A0A1G6KHA2_9BACI|nr:endo-1,4-beta-xylanase [Pelagirhabdus alkalitolerans]SDC30353.1 endo-1,4-beta-xylanase [Pelagirhabdus alkalitolerans]